MKEPAQGLASGKFPVNYGVIIPSAVLVFLGILESISRKPHSLWPTGISPTSELLEIKMASGTQYLLGTVI